MEHTISEEQFTRYIRALTRYELLKNYVKVCDKDEIAPDIWYLRLLTKEGDANDTGRTGGDA